MAEIKLKQDIQKKESAELRNCPFCGAPAQIREICGRWAVECTEHCAGTRIFADKKKSIEAWNRRVDNAD